MDNKDQQFPVNPTPGEKDDALFTQLGKSRKMKKRKLIRLVLTVLIAAAVILMVGTGMMRRRVQDRFAFGKAQVLSWEVTSGTVSTVVSGSGTLQNVDMEAVTVPTGVEVTEILADFGDTVDAGDLLATVDMGTVRSAMAQLQTAIDALDKQIRDAEGDKVDTYLKAGVSGRVKILYAREGMDIADVMVAHGALAVLSLDGYMAVDVRTDALEPGASVNVVLSSGKTVSGTVEYAAAGKATVLIGDDGPAFEEEVAVRLEDGTEIGTGRLYIHNPLSVTGYAGTVSRVNGKENQKVSASTTLFTLTNTASSANYDALLRQRQETEETLLELLRIQRSGGMTAPISGSIYSVGDLDAEFLMEVATVSPDVKMAVTITVDEGDILSLELGQPADVTVSSLGEEVLSGTVTEIDKTGTSGYYTAVIELDKTAGMLPGMTASVDVRIRGVEDALIVPVEAIHQTSAGFYVYTTYDEQTQEYGGKVDVSTGLANHDYVEIRSGLKAGDTVYYTENKTLAELFGQMTGSGSQRSAQPAGQKRG
jgi:multidrug efflux pump subunit AcrA (membrane-fusion protein)